MTCGDNPGSQSMSFDKSHKAGGLKTFWVFFLRVFILLMVLLSLHPHDDITPKGPTSLFYHFRYLISAVPKRGLDVNIQSIMYSWIGFSTVSLKIVLHVLWCLSPYSLQARSWHDYVVKQARAELLKVREFPFS